MRKVFGYVCGILLLIGILLFVGSIAVFTFGPETFTVLYERAKPELPYFLAGLGLIILVAVLSIILWPEQWKPVPAARCDKCGAFSGVHAKFCDQCGATLRNEQPPLGSRAADGTLWVQVRSWLGW